MATLGKLIKEKRKALGLTQTELSKKLGIEQPVISRLEKDFFKLGITEKLIKLCLSLDIDVGELKRLR